MFHKSIRFRITVIYAAILALTMVSFSILLYHNVRAGLYSGMDTLLKSRAGGIAKAVDTYWETSSMEALEAPESPELLRKRRNVNFTRIAQKWVMEESKDPALVGIIVHLFDTDGATIASTRTMRNLADIPERNFITVLQGSSRFDSISLETNGSRMPMRVYTTPIFENQKVAYIVQVASPLGSIHTALNRLQVALFVLLPVTVLLTGVMGAFLAKLTLHPVNSMIDTLQRLTAENMKLRISVPGTKDEIQKLAETFNQMLSRLEEAFSSQRKLFEDLSHELKTPLTILRGELEVLLKKERTRTEYEQAMASALEEIKRITRLAENLLVLARLDSKEVFPEKGRLDISELLEKVISSIIPVAHLKDIALERKIEKDLLSHADAAGMKTVFFNMLDNAVKFTPPKGSISVSAGRFGQYIKVEISDTGIGISEEEMPLVFGRFYRARRSGVEAGFGLGLSIAKAITEAHGGKIEVRNRHPKGTTFTINLPMA